MLQSMSKESGVKKFQARAIKDLLAIEKEATERFACINGILQVAENNFFNKLREERNNLMNAYVQLEEELAASKNVSLKLLCPFCRIDYLFVQETRKIGLVPVKSFSSD